MAIQQADKSQEPRNRDLFPLWVRISAFVLCSILLVGAAAVWLSKVWGSDLSNVMSVIFGVLGVIFGFLALLPFFFHLSDNTEVPTHTTPSGPAQVINNYFGSPPGVSPQPAQFSTTPGTDNQAASRQSSASDNTPPDRQQPSGDGHTIHEPPLPPPISPLLPASSSQSTRPGVAKRNVLDYTLHQRMVRALEGIPATATFEGRNTLLVGLPRNIVAGLSRDRNSDANDLENLLTQLDGLGPLVTGEQPLIIFTQNALRRAEGLDTNSLNTILEELRRRYEAANTSPATSTVMASAEHEQHEPHHTVDSPEPQQEHFANLSSNELRALAHKYIKAAKTSVETASQPFTGKGYILPVKFTEAITLLNATKAQMRNLQALTAHILSLPSEKALDKIAAHYSDIDRKTYIVIAEADRLIASFEDEEHFNRLDIMQKSTRLVTDLNELDLPFEGEEASA